MTNAEIRAFLELFRHAWESQDVKTLGACYAADCVVVSPIFNTLKGRSEVEKSYVELFRALEFQKIRVDDVVIGNEEPPRAVVVWNVEQTHAGEMFGIKPSGKRIEQTVALILTLKDAQITKEVRIYDFTSMLMQLGVLRAKPA
jgi:predicted ester cyclase